MVDLHAKNSSNNRREGKVKILMDRTPNFIKSKFWSVLGNSNDLINGITTKLDISLSMSSSTETESAGHDTNENSKQDDVSIDESLIDFESRKVKERRAYDEVSSGKYRHPNFVTRSAYEDCNMIDINPESSISTSQSNSMLSKSSNTDENPSRLNQSAKKSVSSMKQESDGQATEHEINRFTSNSENHLSAVNESMCDQKPCQRSASLNSMQSSVSITSLENQTESDVFEFMRCFVDILFHESSALTLELKSEFGQKSRIEDGRICFARMISAKRSQTKKVSENTFYSLVQHFAIILFECAESDDFSPAKILMNMCFTFYYEVDVPGCEPYREYLYTNLRDQPIWHALRFWNAAFFDAVQCERSHRPVPKINNLRRNNSKDSASSQAKWTIDTTEENVQILKEDQIFLQNICFGQLGTFTCNMHAFGLSEELCVEFLKKQCVISNLNKEQERMLYDNIKRMYKETAAYNF